MLVTDQLAARIRTLWPMLLGYLAAQLLHLGAPVAAWTHTALGITVTEQQVAAVLGLVLGYGVYETGRWLEHRTGTGRTARTARVLGRLLLSLGLPTGPPTYPRTRVRTTTSVVP